MKEMIEERKKKLLKNRNYKEKKEKKWKFVSFLLKMPSL